jgi:hypothetical protein
MTRLTARDPMKSTPEENKAIMEGSIAYFDTYTVDEAAKTSACRDQHVSESSRNRGKTNGLNIGQ